MSLVAYQSVTKSYDGTKALDAVDLVIEGDSFTVLCGPPQCGKSVLLRLLIGLERPDQGRLLVDGTDITDLPPARRRFGYVPQSFALYPHMSVFDNIAYPLALERAPASDIRARVDRSAEILHIGHLLEKRPDQLSGGEKQRVAIARGLLKDAEIFMLDDPLVGLDFKLREKLIDDLRDMRRELNATFVYATSDSLEALLLADELVVLDGGRVEEQNEAGALYREPQRLRSMQLVGRPQANVLPGRLGDDGSCDTGLFRFPLAPERNPSPAAREVMVGLRPEHIVLGNGAAGLGGAGQVRLVEDLGAEYLVYFEAGGQTLVTLLPASGPLSLAEGQDVDFRVRPERLVVFDAGEGARLGRGAGAAHA